MSINREIINFEEIKFISMNGAGNKILIHDSRNQNIEIDEKLIIFLSNKNELIDFDQFVQICRPDGSADAKLLFWNADGSEAEMCGNAIRCIAKIIIEEKKKKEIHFETVNKKVICWENNTNISVNMGKPNFIWTEIPLKDGRTLHHDVKGKNGSGKVFMRSAPAGTGIIAGGPIRSVCEVLGIQDVVAKSLGSANPHNVLKACVDGLKSQNSPKILSSIRGKKISDIVLKREAK